jgi:hypothetical protein
MFAIGCWLISQVAQGRGPRVFTLFVSGEGEGPQIGSSADGLPPADRAVNVSAAVMQKLAGFDSPPSGTLFGRMTRLFVRLLLYCACRREHDIEVWEALLYALNPGALLSLDAVHAYGD